MRVVAQAVQNGEWDRLLPRISPVDNCPTVQCRSCSTAALAEAAAPTKSVGNRDYRPSLFNLCERCRRAIGDLDLLFRPDRRFVSGIPFRSWLVTQALRQQHVPPSPLSSSSETLFRLPIVWLPQPRRLQRRMNLPAFREGGSGSHQRIAVRVFPLHHFSP